MIGPKQFITAYWTRCLIAFFGITGYSVHAATYFVSQSGDFDFTTIQDCVNIMQPGDQCIVIGGSEQSPIVYDERVSFPSSVTGTEISPIVVRAQPRRSVTIRGFITRNCDYLTIEGFNITDVPTEPDDEGGILVWSDHVTVQDNYFFNVAGPGVQAIRTVPANPTNIHVVNNSFFRCTIGVWAIGNNWLVEGNRIERLYRWPDSRTQDCDYNRFFGRGHIFRDNRAFGTLNSEVGDSHVDGFQTWSTGASNEFAHEILIERNMVFDYNEGVQIRDTVSQQAGEPSDQITSITVRNNFFGRGLPEDGYGDGGLGLNIHGVDQLHVVHNTFVNTYQVVINDWATGVCKNNIFYSMNGLGGLVTDSETKALMDFGYNLWYGVDFSSYYYRTPTDISGQNPLFVDVSEGNFRLQDGSPAIDTGVDVGVDEDIDQSFRPSLSGFDIGAHEYHGGQVQLVMNDISIFEGDTGQKTAIFEIRCNVPPLMTVTVHYETEDRSAQAMLNDYVSTSGALTFTSTSLIQQVPVLVNGDMLDEHDEEFALLLTEVQNAVVPNPIAVCLIIDDDGIPLGDLVGYWRMNDNLGLIATDLSPYENHGFLSAGVVWSDGLEGSAIENVATQAHLSVPTNGWSATNGTLALWVFVRDFLDQPQYFFGHATVPWGNRIQLYTETIKGTLNIGLGDNHRVASNIIHLPKGVWHHLALTWDGSEYVLYRNGDVLSSGTYTGLDTIASFADIGNTGYATERDQAVLGTIDEVYLFRTTLDAIGVRDLYEKLKDVVPPPLTAAQHWTHYTD